MENFCSRAGDGRICETGRNDTSDEVRKGGYAMHEDPKVREVGRSDNHATPTGQSQILKCFGRRNMTYPQKIKHR